MKTKGKGECSDRAACFCREPTFQCYEPAGIPLHPIRRVFLCVKEKQYICFCNIAVANLGLYLNLLPSITLKKTLTQSLEGLNAFIYLFIYLLPVLAAAL